MSTFNGTGRKSWSYKDEAKKYHAKHGFKPYTMVWNKNLEREMMDSDLPKEQRVHAAVKRFAWGNLSDWAVDGLPPKNDTDPKPRALTQEALGRILNLSAASMSEACIFLKERGYFRKDHIFLFPVSDSNPLESVNNSGVDSNSTDSFSPYLRFEESYLSANPKLARSIEEVSSRRNSFQKKAREQTRELLKMKREILCAWRDRLRKEEEQKTQQNQQKQDDSETCPSLTTLVHSCAQSTHDNREEKENKPPVCDETYNTESDSNSKMEWFATPEPPPMESESHSAKKPNKKPSTATAPLNPLKLKGNGTSVSRSVSPAGKNGDRPTDRHQEIIDSIPADLLQRIQDAPTAKLLDRIDQKIGRAPLSAFAERIAARWETITSLGILASLADDARRAWEKSESDREAGIPPAPATRLEAKREKLLRGMEILDRMQGRVS